MYNTQASKVDLTAFYLQNCFTRLSHQSLTLKVLVTTKDAQSEGMGDVGSASGEVRAGTTSSMPDHKGFKLQ